MSDEIHRIDTDRIDHYKIKVRLVGNDEWQYHDIFQTCYDTLKEAKEVVDKNRVSGEYKGYCEFKIVGIIEIGIDY